MSDINNENSSDETSSYSEEEVMEVDDGGDENELAIETILEENERLEEEENAFLETKRKGKQKAPKSPSSSPDINVQMWKELKRLKQQMNSLKRPRENDVSSNAKGESSAKKNKMDIDVATRPAFHHPGSSKDTNERQLSSAKPKQLSSATSSQLRSVIKGKQLSSSAQSSQLSSATSKPKTVVKSLASQNDDNELDIHEEDVEDPLRIEAEEIQRTGNDNDDVDDVSSDEDIDDIEEEGENIFADLVKAVTIEGDKEKPGPPVDDDWAEKINSAWKTKMNKLSHTHMLQKYKIASNLNALKVPSVNKEIWKPLSKWQKKADLNMTSCQRSLISAVSAVMKLSDYIGSLPRATRQIAMQTAADIVSLLGKVNRELMTRRKISARSVLVGDYKTLATTTEVSEENLFGDNLTQDIKDVNIRRKIADPNAYTYRGSDRRHWRSHRGAYNNNYNNYGNGNSFLWRGRGRSRPYNRASQNSRNQGHNNSHQSKKGY